MPRKRRVPKKRVASKRSISERLWQWLEGELENRPSVFEPELLAHTDEARDSEFWLDIRDEVLAGNIEVRPAPQKSVEVTE